MKGLSDRNRNGGENPDEDSDKRRKQNINENREREIERKKDDKTTDREIPQRGETRRGRRARHKRGGKRGESLKHSPAVLRMTDVSEESEQTEKWTRQLYRFSGGVNKGNIRDPNNTGGGRSSGKQGVKWPVEISSYPY